MVGKYQTGAVNIGGDRLKIEFAPEPGRSRTSEQLPYNQVAPSTFHNYRLLVKNQILLYTSF
jgi:hypothetical protein